MTAVTSHVSAEIASITKAGSNLSTMASQIRSGSLLQKVNDDEFHDVKNAMDDFCDKWMNAFSNFLGDIEKCGEIVTASGNLYDQADTELAAAFNKSMQSGTQA